MKTIEPNTPAEQQQLLAAANRPDVQFECACIGNILDGMTSNDGGWIDATQYGPFHFQSLRYRIKMQSSAPSPGPTFHVGSLSERELLAIMSATLFDNYSGPNTPEKVVTIARKILHEIDNTNC